MFPRDASVNGILSLQPGALFLGHQHVVGLGNIIEEKWNVSVVGDRSNTDEAPVSCVHMAMFSCHTACTRYGYVQRHPQWQVRFYTSY